MGVCVLHTPTHAHINIYIYIYIYKAVGILLVSHLFVLSAFKQLEERKTLETSRLFIYIIRDTQTVMFLVCNQFLACVCVCVCVCLYSPRALTPDE